MNRNFRSGGHGPRPFRSDDGPRPVNVGDELDVKIEAVGEKGDGIAKKDGFVLFVPSTQQGDNVKVRVTKVLRRVGFAEVIGKADGKPTENHAPRPAPKREPDPQDSEDFGEEGETSGEDSSESSESEDFVEDETQDYEEEK